MYLCVCACVYGFQVQGVGLRNLSSVQEHLGTVYNVNTAEARQIVQVLLARIYC